jgi:hypothetical protein
MYEQKKTVETIGTTAGRTEWKSPEVRRMSAGQAETAFTSGSDGATQAS